MAPKKGSMLKVRSGSTIEERIEFHSIFIPECGCRIWTGNVNNEGYPYLWIDDRNVTVPRFILEKKIGYLSAESVTRHTCDTPRCIAEDHLVLGTHRDNKDDMIQRGRILQGEKLPQAKLSIGQVIAIRVSTGSLIEIAQQFGISRSNVWLIKSRKTWAHLL